MKKAFDQTVRDLKREVNKKVLKVPGVEQKILDATSNEPWGPHGSLLADIAHATRNHHEYQIIMNVIWKRINDTGRNWRHVYKGLTVLEYLVAHGSERIIDEIREHAYQISTLSDFQYNDSGGRDQGNNVRRKSQTLVALVNDKERIQEVRQKAQSNRDKYRSTYSTGRSYRPGSSPGNGGYGDRYDDDQFESRYGSKNDDRNGYARERDWGYKDDDKYGRGGESYNRDGDRYGRDSDEQYGRDSYRDSDDRGGRESDDQFGSRNRNYERDRARSFDEDDRYASRGDRADDAFQDERLERKVSEQNVTAPPSYDEAIRDGPEHVQGESSRNEKVVAAHASKTYSSPAYKAGSPESISQVPNHVAGVSASAHNKEVDDFDEFDPRGSASAIPPASISSRMDFFGTQASDPVNSLALVPVSSYTNSEADMSTNSGLGTTFGALPSTSTSMSQPSEDPFGVSPFKATPQEDFPAQQQNFPPPTSFHPTSGLTVGAAPLPPAAPKMETSSNFDFGDPLGGLTYVPTVANYQQSSANPALLGASFPQAGFAASVSSNGPQPDGQRNLQTANMNYLQQPGATQPVALAHFPTAPMNLLQQPVPLASQAHLTTTVGSSAKTHPPNDKFETKSTVWADTLSRGLVNLNISGSKINPLADIGVDFDSINRMDKRKQERGSAAPAISTIAMGKAMGAGSGIGRATVNSVAPPNPMMGSGMGVGRGMAGGGMGMGYGGGINQHMGMGMGMNTAMGMGMNPGSLMRPPIRMPTGTGMPGIGYNPMMGMGNYGSQQPEGGGNR